MEQIYTIPVNEAFEAVRTPEGAGCPFCRLYRQLEMKEVDLILGASMMEPDVRVKTNELGFCEHHLDLLYAGGKRLPLALMLQSHLDAVAEDLKGNMGMFVGKTGERAARRLDKLDGSCYICERVNYHFARMFETAVLLWQSDSAFHEKVAATPRFCLSHFGRFVKTAKERLSRKDFAEFYEQVYGIESAALDKVRDDINWFCKKFDYRYENEPWGDAKDAPERARILLKGDRDILA